MVRARTSSRGHQNSASLKNMKSVIISVKSDMVATDHIIGSDDAMFMPSTEMNDHTSTPRLTLRPIVAAPLLQSLAVGGWEYAGERRADRCILRGRDAARAARGAADARVVCAVIRKCSNDVSPYGRGAHERAARCGRIAARACAVRAER